MLSQLLQLRKEHFHLYQPLRMLLQLEPDDLLALQDALPRLQPVQMLQLLALLQLQPFDVLELKRILQESRLTSNHDSQLVELGMESNLYIAPVLIRCDTLEEKNKLLTGNKPVKVCPRDTHPLHHDSN